MNPLITSFADDFNHKIEMVLSARCADNLRMSIGDRIKQARKAAKLTQQAFADAIGASQSAVGNWESSLNNPDRGRILKIAEVLNVSPYWLEFGGADDKARSYEIKSNAAPVGPVQFPQHDLPILGAALGGDDAGVFMDNGGHFGTTGRPANLVGVKGAYAIYAVGESMEPRYAQGELLLVNPFKPVVQGCYVVVQLAPANDGDDRTYLVKQFTRRNARELVLKQFNPAKDLKFPSNQVIAVHRIVGMAEE